MTRIYQGRLSNGVVQLTEPVDPSIDAHVTVTVADERPSRGGQPIYFGMLRGQLPDMDEGDFKKLRHELSTQWERKWDELEAGD